MDWWLMCKRMMLISQSNSVADAETIYLIPKVRGFFGRPDAVVYAETVRLTEIANGWPKAAKRVLLEWSMDGRIQRAVIRIVDFVQQGNGLLETYETHCRDCHIFDARNRPVLCRLTPAAERYYLNYGVEMALKRGFIEIVLATGQEAKRIDMGERIYCRYYIVPGRLFRD